MGGHVSRPAGGAAGRQANDVEEYEVLEDSEHHPQMRTPMDLDSEVSVDSFVQEQYSMSQGGQCVRCKPAQKEGEPLSLVEICVDEICRNILRYESTEPFECLPPELVVRIMQSLSAHRALVRLALHALEASDVTRLDFSDCKDVTDKWLEPFANKALKHLNAARSNLTDAGLLQCKNLHELMYCDLSNCAGLTGEGLAVLEASWHLHTLKLSGCHNLGDQGLLHLSHLPALTHLYLDGSRRLTDFGLEALRPLLPQLRSLVLNQTGARFSVQALTACLSALHDIELLDLGHCVNSVARETVEVLTGGQAVASLQVLILDGCRLDNSDLYALAQLTHLRHLSLRGASKITDAGLCQLPPALEILDVSHCKGVRRFPAQPLPHLYKINMAHSGLRDPDVSSLAEFPALRDVDLDSCAVGNSGLASLTPLQGLTRLCLADTNVSDQGMDVLADLPALRELSLFYCNISDLGVRRLSHLQQQLTSLNLDSRDLTDSSFQSISSLTSLQHLDLFSARISDAALPSLLSLTSLTHLTLCGGRISDQGLEHVGGLSKLTNLSLSQNSRVTNAGLHHLVDLTDLEILNVSHTSVAAPGALVPLRKLRGGLKVLAVNCCKGFDEDTVENLKSSLPYLRTVKAVPVYAHAHA